MDYEKRLAISYYESIATINEEHHIYLVQHQKTKKIFIKKIISVYNRSLYDFLYSHPILGLPRIYEIYEENNILTIIEEYISGENLADILSLSKALPEKIAVNYILQLCDIVSKLHSINPPVIHRDIKPSNIIITPYHNVVLLDFNAAKYMDNTKSKDTVLLGTKGFAAPEQYGFGTSDMRTDVYAIGTLLKVMLTGNLDHNVSEKHRLYKIIEKSTSLDPQNRFQTAGNFKRELLKTIDPEKRFQKLSNWDFTYISKPPKYPFLPPGFRNLNPANMILFALIYTLTFTIGPDLTVDGITGIPLLFVRVGFTLGTLITIFFASNYLNMQRFFPLANSKNVLIRIPSIIIYSILIFCAFIIISLYGQSLIKIILSV